MRTRIFTSTLVMVMAAALTASAQTATSSSSPATAAQAEARASAEAARQAARAGRDAARQAERVAREASAGTSREDALYKRGTAALDGGHWTQALEIYTQLAEMRGARADASTYWKAYAQYKLGQRDAALATIQGFQQAFPSSRWLSEANALSVEIRSAAGDTAAAAQSGDEELKLLALNGLMESGNVDQAVAMIEKMLKSQQPPKLKKRALFVLSQNESPKARDVVVTIAKGGSNPDLQMDAIQYLGIFGGKQNQQVLADIYAGSTDVAVKRRILQAYMVSGQKERLLAAAKGETNAKLRGEAIRMLGVQGATTELAQLYEVEKTAELKNALIEAFMLTGNVDRLLEIAKNEKDTEVKVKAVRMLGVMGSAKTGSLLVEMYAAPGSTPEIKHSVIEGLFIQGNAKALVDIARKETDPALRKSLVERLSLMKSKEATDFLMELLNK